MSFSINEDKTKYLGMSKGVINKSNYKIESCYFEQVDDFKYELISLMRNKILIKMCAANCTYIAMKKMPSFNIPSKTTKVELYTYYLRTIVMYARETWFATQGDDEKLLTFERKVLRVIHGKIKIKSIK